MIISKEVKMNWSNRNKTYYENLGYKWTGNKNEFYVKVKDLPPHSNVIINVSCDFCGKVMNLQYYDYTKRKKKNDVNEDCCKECSPLKHKKVMLNKYGVESPMHLEDVSRKVSEARKLDYDYVKEHIEKRGFVMLSTEYLGGNSKLKLYCPKHDLKFETTWNNFYKSESGSCPKCHKDIISKENSYLWKGGISPLHNHLRKKIQPWKEDSMRQCDFKCIITGENFNVIHHLYGFKDILNETLNNLNLAVYEEVERYSDLELEMIEEECLRLHYKYGLGVCLKDELHKEFHSIYGQKDFTKDNFEEFVLNKTGRKLEEILIKGGLLDGYR